jgi:alkanesulfonate monooxygenase SsuD/methylene tetrahydromethanopterin reductase-like flavin-dependent oxidoreductase (luciferase family)
VLHQQASSESYGMRQLGKLGMNELPKTPGDIPREIALRYAVIGTPTFVVKRLEEYVDAGARHFLWIASFGPSRELFAREVLPHFT